MTLVREGGLSFFIPIAVLIGMLIYGFTPIYAAGAAILSCVGASWISRDHRMGPKEILEALALGSRNMVMTAILLCTVGLIVNVIATTGLGNTFSLMIATWSGGSILLAGAWHGAAGDGGLHRAWNTGGTGPYAAFSSARGAGHDGGWSIARKCARLLYAAATGVCWQA